MILYGGRFDPIHRGHMQVIQSIKHYFPTEKLIILIHDHHLKGSPMFTFQARKHFIEKLLNKYNIKVDDIWYSNKASLFEVIKEYRAFGASIVLGDDAFLGLHAWLNSEKLIESVRSFIVFTRRHSKEEIRKYAEINKLNVVIPDLIVQDEFKAYSSTLVRSKITSLILEDKVTSIPLTPVLATLLCVVTEDNSRMLLIKHKSTNSYAIPGGFVDFGKSPVEVALSEFEEETGIKKMALLEHLVSGPKLLEAITVPDDDKDVFLLIYKCTVSNQLPFRMANAVYYRSKYMDHDESSGFIWASKDEIQNLRFRFPLHKQLLQTILK